MLNDAIVLDLCMFHPARIKKFSQGKGLEVMHLLCRSIVNLDHQDAMQQEGRACFRKPARDRKGTHFNFSKILICSFLIILFLLSSLLSFIIF